jgi:hypothetical protein
MVLVRDESGKLPKTQIEVKDGCLVEPWVIMVQVINHATEHREQIKSLITFLGVTHPKIDGWSYGRVTNAYDFHHVPLITRLDLYSAKPVRQYKQRKENHKSR